MPKLKTTQSVEIIPKSETNTISGKAAKLKADPKSIEAAKSEDAQKLQQIDEGPRSDEASKSDEAPKLDEAPKIKKVRKLLTTPISKSILDYAQITLGVVLFACAVNLFYEPNGLVTGGVSGIGIIINTLAQKHLGFTIPLWLTNITLNAPLFAVGARVLGLKFIGRTIYATLALTLLLFLTSFFLHFSVLDKSLAAIFGGALSGAGLGLVFRCSATTGGSDLAASILNKRVPHIPLAKFMLIIDAIVVTFGFFVFGPECALYAIIAIFISAKVSGALLEGVGYARAAFIISDSYAQIAETVTRKMGRGVTSLSGTGMYTGSDKRVLFSVVSIKQVAQLKDLVTAIDPNAFIIVTDAREVLGEGFRRT